MVPWQKVFNTKRMEMSPAKPPFFMGKHVDVYVQEKTLGVILLPVEISPVTFPRKTALFFMCFSGIGSLRISDEISNEFGEIKETKFIAGNVIFVPANEKHQSKNNSEETVKSLCLTPCISEFCARTFQCKKLIIQRLA